MFNKKFWILIILLLFVLIPFASASDDMDISNQTINDINYEEVILEESNDIYFNSSVTSDGDGSQANPYKYLKSSRIADNSTLHIADGVYVLDSSKKINENVFVNVYGQSRQNTIIQYTGTVFNNNGILNLYNLTIKGTSVKNNNEFSASDVIFRDCPSGSAISAVGSNNVLFNCEFYNNTAYSGGAIYASTANFTISDSILSNNSARIAGAIYLTYDSPCYIYNSTMSFNTALIGGAICSLDSGLYLSGSKLYNNSAEFYGGAIYEMYAELELNNSRFYNNTADIGGAVYCDYALFNMSSNEFRDNKAYSKKGSAVYSSVNTVNFTNNTYINNELYEIDYYEYVYKSGNYTQLIYNSSYEGYLPSSYDLRDYGYVTPVKNQGSDGNCWAFAGIGTLESCIIKAGGEVLDLSEENMKNIIAFFSSNGWNMLPNWGGYLEMPVGYYSGWLGPALESDDPYVLDSFLSPLYDSLYHVQNILFINRTSYTDNDAVKRAIMDYGAVFTGIKMVNAKNQYYTGNDGSDHAVCVIGWDDNYSRNNFATKPPGDGAWICKNSWGTSSGYGGYFYVSYYDTSCLRLNDPGSSYTFIFNDTVRYDNSYQYDVIGKTDYLLTDQPVMWYQNNFNASSDEIIAAFSTYFNMPTNWTAEVYVNDNLMITQSGSASCGYYTFNFDEFIPVYAGDSFKIILKIVTADEAWIPISENYSSTRVHYFRNTSFLSFDGETWIDLFNYNYEGRGHWYESQVACLKAFTINCLSTNITFRDLEISSGMVNIVCSVADAYGNAVNMGNLTFTVNGQNYTVFASNGIASLANVSLDNHTLNLTVSYNENSHYLHSVMSEIINIPYAVLSVSIEDICYGEDLYANITLKTDEGVLINDTVELIIEGNVYNVTSNTIFLIPDSYDAGNYTAKAIYVDDNIPISSYDAFTVNKCDVNLLLNISNIVYGDYLTVIAELIDSNGVNINETLVLTLGGKNYTFNSNSSYVVCDVLDAGSYSVDVYYNGSANYNSASANATCIITKFTPFLDLDDIVSTYGSSIQLTVGLLGVDGIALNENVILNISSDTYTVTANNPYVIETLFNASSYTVFVYFSGDKNYNSVNMTVNLTVLKSDVSINLEIPGIAYDDDIPVNVTLKDLSGKELMYVCILTIENETYLVGANAINFIMHSFNPGNYSAKIEFSGSNNYNMANDTCNFSIYKSYVNLTLNIEDSIYGEDLIVTADLINSKGSFMFKELDLIINSQSYTITSSIVNYIKTNLSASNYTAFVSYDDIPYYFASNTTKFSIDKANLTLDIIVDETGNNVSVTFNLSSKIDAKLIVNINDDEYELNITDGVAVLDLYDLNLGQYDIAAQLISANYWANASSGFTIESNTSKIIFNDIVMYYHDGTRLEAILTDSFGNPLSNRTLNVYINGVNYTRITDSQGLISMALNLNSGNYTTFISFAGDSSHNSSSANATVSIKSTIIASDLVKYFRNASQFYAKLLDYNGNAVANTVVRMNINGVFYDRTTNDEGIVRLNINLVPNDYVLTITNPVTGESGSVTVTVLSRIVDNYNLVKYYRNDSKYSVRILSENGTPLSNVGVKFNINGVVYTRYTDSEGVASLSINLVPGEYVITVQYGDSVVSNNITVLTILETSNLVMKYRDGSRFQARALDGQGNPCVNVAVKFNINGVLYTRYTNSEGIARLNINLNRGYYIITSIYDEYSVGNTVTIT